MNDNERDHAGVPGAEGVLAFDPKMFKSDYRVIRWEPRREVQFDRPLSLAAIALAIFCFVFTALIAWGGTVVLKEGLHPTSSVRQPIVALLAFVVFGLIPAFFGFVLLRAALPRRARIDWVAATITTGGLWKKETPLSEVVGLEMNRVHKRTSLSGNHAGGTTVRHTYWCQLRAKLRGEAGQSAPPLLLVETEPREDGGEGPFRQMLPLATELAAALGVRRDVVSSEL